MKHRQAQYQLLGHLGVSLFKHRNTFCALDSQKLFLMPSCLVVLPSSPVVWNPESKKILSGMLSVLDVSYDSICTVWRASQDHFSIMDALFALAPHSVLLLGEIFPPEMMSIWINNCHLLECISFTSFHPNLLAENSKHKVETYNTLLQLKNYLRIKKCS